MANIARFVRNVPFCSIVRPQIRCMSGGDWGSGAGKGGGAGGSVREAGGAFGKMEVAHEEQYFRKLQQEQLEKLKEHLQEEVSHHKNEIERHEDVIKRHKKRIHDIKKMDDD